MVFRLRFQYLTAVVFTLLRGMPSRAGWLCLAGLGLPAFVSHAHDFVPVVKSQRDKVVHIKTVEKEEEGGVSSESFLAPDARQGMGSGFIIHPDGYIVTNNHVVAEAARIEVVFSDERHLPARVVGLDPQTDLALLKVEAKGLPAVTFGDSSKVEVGSWVLAIGNPLGLTQTVTAGIISAKGRNIFTEENLAYGEFLQTDAAINPGNSGGPLFDLTGKVVGVNSAISRQGQGIGFAVPSNLVVKIIRQLREHGRVIRGWLGVVIREVDADHSRRLELPRNARGVMIEEVLPDSPALVAGLVKGDVLTHLGELSVRKVAHLQKLVALTAPGGTARLRGWRRSGEGAPWAALDKTVTLGRNPHTADQSRTSLLARLGIRTMNIPESLRRRIKLDRSGGVLVETVAPGGVGAVLGLHAGDIILEVNETEVASRAALESLLAQAKQARIPILVRRQRTILFLVLESTALGR